VLKADQVAGQIDSVQLELKREQLMANIKGVESQRPDVDLQIAATRQQIDTAMTEKKRIENLLKSDAANGKQLDDINAQIATLEKQLVAQRSSLIKSGTGITEQTAALELQIAQLDDLIRKCTITSPIDGTVLVKYAEKGEFATEGKPLFKIADLEQIFLRVYINSGQLSDIKPGQIVTVLSDSGKKKERKYTGKVTWISGTAEFTPKTVQTRDERANLVYAVKVAVKNDGYLKIGMYGGIKIAHE
jgi:HlyD family secretion protein